MVVLHCTEEPDLAAARRLADKTTEGIGGHIYIDRDGKVEQWVDFDRISRHTYGYNERSIGIELVNLGRYPDHFRSDNQQMTEPFTENQKSSLSELLVRLVKELPNLNTIARHSDLDKRFRPASDNPSIQVRRRLDPGPMFPWDEFLSTWKGLVQFRNSD
jgi:N-acetylmuramoyl-L-alanine amidase